MSFRELSMIEVKEVLRRHQAGQAVREIARETGLDRKTVRRYLAQAVAHEVSTQTPLTDDVVHEVADAVQSRPLPEPSEPRQLLAPHRARIERWLSGTHDGSDGRALRLTKVRTLLARQGVEVTYATLRRYVIDELGWRQRKPTVRVDDPEPGHEAQIDFGCMGMLRDETTGRARKLWVLIVTLTCSRYQFVWPTFSQTTEALCEGLDAAWAFFEGVPRRWVTDNMSAAIDIAHRTSPRINDVFADYAQARGAFVDAARVRHPQDKPRVENQVAFVRESWWDGELFTGLDDTRRSAEHWCRVTAGGRVHGTTQRVPRDDYAERERPHMLPAPTVPFDVPLWTEAKVHPDHHIQVQRALYSVPTRYIGRRVRVRSDSRLVRIYAGTELVKIHPRKVRGERSTDPSDYPPGRSDCALRSVDEIVNRAHKQGEHVGVYAERLLDGPLPWTRMRQGYQLLRLCKRYSAERVDAMCRRALDFDVIDVPRVERMLKSAMRTEQDVAEQGKLRQLPLSPRFARDARVFGTRQKPEEV